MIKFRITSKLVRIGGSFALTLLFFNGTYAQTTEEVGTASFDANACLVLPESAPLLSKYVAPVDNLTQQTEKEIVKAFGHESSNLVTFTYDSDNHQAIIYIHTDRTSVPAAQTVSWWNNYLKDASMNYLNQP